MITATSFLLALALVCLVINSIISRESEPPVIAAFYWSPPKTPEEWIQRGYTDDVSRALVRVHRARNDMK